MKRIMKWFILCVVGCFILAIVALYSVCHVFNYVYSTSKFAFEPQKLEPKDDGIEYYVTDTGGGRYVASEGSVPVFFCKFGNMIAVNVVGFEMPFLLKAGNGNKIVVLTGNEGDSPYKAHSECQIVVMDADEGEMSVAQPTADDMKAIWNMRRVEVNDHIVSCYNEAGLCHKIRVREKHKGNSLFRLWNRHVIATAVKRGCSHGNLSKKWFDPETGLRWTYVETKDGVEIVDKRTYGCAVSPMPTGTITIPGYINGKPVKCIGENVIVNCNIETVCIPKTVERFAEGAPFSLGNINMKRVEVEDGNARFQSKDGLLYDVTGKVLLFVPRNLLEVWIPDGVTNIADKAFYYCHSMRNVTVPASVKVLGEGVFSMSSVKEVRFLGDAPKVPNARLSGIYWSAPTDLTTIAFQNAEGWKADGRMPTMWCDRPIVFE